MAALLIMILAFAGYIIMYQLYGKFIGNKIFALSAAAKAPSVELEDGMDYVPTKKEVIFGHHFTSIAGTGPIVGPAIAIIWGWLPALIWIFVGTIVIGAVHDFGALIISMRNQGKSISEYTAKYINNRTKIFFFLIVFLELWIVIAIFGLVIAVVFTMYPQSVIPVWLEIPIAVYLGYLIYKKGKNVMTWSIIAVIVMYATFIIGYYVPFKMPTILGIPPTGVWTIILLTYAFIASVLPVTTLLQPRDFINSHQLVIALALLILGVLFAAFGGNLHIVAPAVQAAPAKAPPMWPFLFITIACGAISGFHSLVSSGTSSKQVRSEEDSLFVGYGSMLMEGALATLAIVAVAGPAANLLMAIVWALLVRAAPLFGEAGVALVYMGIAGVFINTVLMVLNLLPLPPLDGGRVMTGLLPGPLAYRFSRIEPFGFMILIALLITGVLGKILLPVIMLIMGALAMLTGLSGETFTRVLFSLLGI